MFFIASPDDFVCPDEEESGHKAGILFKAGLIGVLFVYLELLFRVLFLHIYLYISEKIN